MTTAQDQLPHHIPTTSVPGRTTPSIDRMKRYEPGDPGYDEFRLGWNRAIDSRPAVIAAAETAADVRAAVRAARERGLPLAVQATGHGLVVPADGALLLRTTAMNRVEIDPHRRVARVGPGAIWADVNRAAARCGLAGLAGRCSTVGVTGYTLAGGQSWLSRTFGFAADSVVSADLVTADGDALTVSAHQHPDLFWALRGGGGNFGIVTSLEFRLYPVARVFSGMSLHPIERAADTLDAYRGWAPDEPEAMNTAVLLIRLPPSGERVLAIRAFHHGDDGTEILSPLLKAAGPPLKDAYAMRPFPAASDATNGPEAPPMAIRQQIELFRTLPDGVLDAIVEAGAPDSPAAFVELRHWGGAMADPGPGAGPAGHRDVPYSVMSVGPAAGNPKASPYATGGSFLGLLTDHTKTRTAFTPANYARLAAVKRAWDPDNVFRLGHNIPPATDRKATA
jgi:FAD/FMN-containing dehydrogenase